MVTDRRTRNGRNKLVDHLICLLRHSDRGKLGSNIIILPEFVGAEVYDHPVTMAQASAAAWLQDATTGKIYCGATWFRTSSPQRHVMTMDTCVTNGPAMSNIM